MRALVALSLLVLVAGCTTTRRDGSPRIQTSSDANRESLPANIRDHREVIVALIMDGVATEAAFVQALEKPAFAW